MRAGRTVLFPLSLALASAAQAEIQYRLTPLPEAKRIRVEMTIPVVGRETTIQMPRWHPGWYSLQNQTKDLKDLVARDAAGQDVGAISVDDHTWRIPGGNAGSIKVSYTLPTEGGDSFDLSGPAIYMYVVGRKEEPCRLNLNLPAGWQVAVGLTGEGTEYRASDYDVLADNPLTLGKFRTVTYYVQGKPHLLAFSGPKAEAVDGRAVAAECRKITEMQSFFFGGLPYDKYVWHFNVSEGENWAGGLEHLSSTQIGFGEKVGWRTKSVFSHEFFHLWNVKRIRSKPLGPFDYQKLPRTGALWWLEGVTDYYAGLMLRRAGIYDDAQYLNHIVDSVRTQRANPARFEVSPYQASESVADANDGKGNSTGFKISYYDTGYLVGLCLDLELRNQTGGKRNLDDVTRNLYRLCKGKPGFEEGEIRRQLVLEGGEAMGTLYDRIVLKAGELPLEKSLGYAGLKLSQAKREVAALGFETNEVDGHPVVSKIEGSELKSGDVIQLSPRQLTRLARNGTPGTVVEIRVQRDGKEIVVNHTLKSETELTWMLEAAPNATPEQLRLRRQWLSKAGRDTTAL